MKSTENIKEITFEDCLKFFRYLQGKKYNFNYKKFENEFSIVSKEFEDAIDKRKTHKYKSHVFQILIDKYIDILKKTPQGEIKIKRLKQDLKYERFHPDLINNL